MMAGIDQVSYFSGMKKSFDDKSRLINFAKRGSVLEIGFGEGDLLALFQEKGFDAYGIDASETSIKVASAKHGSKLKNIAYGSAFNIHKIYKGKTFDNVVLCSSLHEIYSYERNRLIDNGHDHPEASARTKVNLMFYNIYNLLNIGGKIIIRDGVAPKNGRSRALINKKKYGHLLKELLFSKYQIFNEVTIKNNIDCENYYIEGLNCDIAEILFTLCWGEDAFERESKETYTAFSDFDLTNSVDLFRFKLKHSEEYITDGYAKFFRECYLTNNENNDINFHSNKIWVFEKR